jgi:uncharacterized protein YndB with AHSA1/START domain
MGIATTDQTVHVFEINKVEPIDAPIEIAFQATLEELGPESRMPDGKSLNLKLEAWPGGRWFRDLGNGVGHFWGHVQVIKPPALLEISGPMMMSFPAHNFVQYRFTAEGNRTTLKFSHRAMGLIPPEMRDGMDEGWSQWLKSIASLAAKRAASKAASR